MNDQRNMRVQIEFDLTIAVSNRNLTKERQILTG